MKIDDVLELDVVALGTNGEGIAKTEDITVFVPFALPGETVVAKITKQKKNIAEACLLGVKKRSPERQNPHCPYFGKCGGCDFLHMSYDAQLQFKQNLVKNNLKKIGKIDVDVLECIPSKKEFGYRNKMAFPISENGVSMFEANSNNFVAISFCMLAGEWCQKLIEIFNDWFFETKQAAFNRKNSNGLLKHLVARFEGNCLLVCLVATNQNVPNIDVFAQKLAKVFKDFGLFVNVNSQNAAKIFSEKFVHVCGKKEILLNNFGLVYSISIGSFEQVNPPIAEKIYEKVAAEVDGNIVVNAYSGAGLLSGILANRSKRVFGIEIDKNAHANAEGLKQKNKITNLENICGDCSEELEKIKSFDSIVLDPPRSGCDKKVIETINKVAPQKIIYISCDSATLARDISRLSDYSIKSVQPFDMFPETKHVETLCVLERNA